MTQAPSASGAARLAAYALADWGTTHLRIWLTDADGVVLGMDQNASGMGGLAPADFPIVLERVLAGLGAPSGLPVLICGMAGARQGWREAAYASCPVALDALAAQAVAFESSGRAIRIMPGIARRGGGRPDVMRGEETQLLGLGLRNGLACLPGTHSKWVRLENGLVSDFATAMTGELFALLSSQSILRHAVDAAEAVSPSDPVFLGYVGHGLSGAGGMARLFSVRAASLLEGMGKAEATAALSGLLIGTEIRDASSLLGVSGGALNIIGSGSLGRLYEAALTIAGFAPIVQDGAATVRAGLLAAAHHHFGTATRAAE
jgi:2-dehydro-3-deoxygalactonokinase